ncbi:unnamed protein product [Closterium sp. NIES-64]|nr:unnamed protein product [Closterium sp. NIES-64]
MSWAQGGGGGGGGGVGGAPPPTSTIYVANLPPGADEELLAEHFGTIGLIKRDKRTGRAKVWLYRDKESMALKGDATVTYEDPFAAAAAVDWFHNKDFHGRTIAVSLAQTKHGSAGGAGGGGNGFGHSGDVSGRGEEGGGGGEVRGGGGGDGGAVTAAAQGKPWQQQGDWMCAAMCGNMNWAKRAKCNICNTSRPGTSEGGAREGRGGGYKELDEAELEETRKRRKEAEEVRGGIGEEKRVGRRVGEGCSGDGRWWLGVGEAVGWTTGDARRVWQPQEEGPLLRTTPFPPSSPRSLLCSSQPFALAQDDGEMYDEFGNLKKKFRKKSSFEAP